MMRKWRRRKIGAREREGAAGEAKLEEGGKKGKSRGCGYERGRGWRGGGGLMLVLEGMDGI